jgi:hypothetical protein
MKQINDDVEVLDEYIKVIIPQVSENWLFQYNNSKHDIEWNVAPEVAAIRPETKSAIAISYFTTQYYNNAD